MHPPKCGVRQRRWENQRKLSSFQLFLVAETDLYTPVYYVLQSQSVATGYANNKIHKEAVKIDIKCKHGYTKQ